MNAAYDDPEKSAHIKNYTTVIFKQITIHGYRARTYSKRFPESLKALEDAVASGKLLLEGVEMVENIGDKLEEIPRIWARLFSGTNMGKLVTKLAD